MTTESNVIETVSASVSIKPQDRRCRYWAKVLRAGCALPLPSAVEGANDVPGAYLRNGEEELFPGDVLIEGEANHHVKQRGWTYNVSVCGAEGKQSYLVTDKTALKANGLPAHLLAGSGDVAACIRLAHAYRLNLL